MTQDHRDARSAGHRADDGFTLIEVIVSLVMLGIVATGALGFFLRANATASHLQRTQAAVAVANEAMERVHALVPQDDATGGVGVPGLVMGRAAADVTAAWNAMAAAGVHALGLTHPLWDPSAAAGSAAAVLPVTYTTTVSGQRYTVTTLVGTCFRDRAGTGQTCTRAAGADPTPGTPWLPGEAPSAGQIGMLRAVVAVTWSQGGQCPTAGCLYELSTLVDRSLDATWNRVVEPIARPDAGAVKAGQTTVVEVLLNDQRGPLGTSPVQLVSLPAAGTATTTTAGTVRYVAPATLASPGTPETYTLSYRIKDARGAQSEPATVTLTVEP